MILPLALCLAFYQWQSAGHRSRRTTWRMVLENLARSEPLDCFLLVLIATVLLVSLVFYFSRMGLISMLVSLGVMAGVVWTDRRHSPLPVALILLLLAGGVAAAAWVGVGPVVERFEQLPRNEHLSGGIEGRVALWKDAVKLIQRHPWTGVGLGSFEYAFANVQSIRLTYIADHAHNDYFELTSEMGLPCAELLFSLFFWLAARMLQASLTRALSIGTLGSTSALLVHSVADFNLYIPANAQMFSVILGLGYALSLDVRADMHAAAIGTSEGGNFPGRLASCYAFLLRASGSVYPGEFICLGAIKCHHRRGNG
jgi:O-antigen ligase